MRTRTHVTNAAHTCTRLHTFAFYIDLQMVMNSTQNKESAHALHKFAHTLHTSTRFAHKRRGLHTNFSFCTQRS